MNKIHHITPHIPYLRRYARALTGSQASGDSYVAAALESLVVEPSAVPDSDNVRVDLYRLFTSIWQSIDLNTKGEAPEGLDTERTERTHLSAITPLPRQAFLLMALEGFDMAEVGNILGLTDAEVSDLTKQAGEEIADQVATDVLIIEDEPIIAMEIGDIVTNLGHNVVAVSRTHREAVAAVKKHKPGLVLADIQLADGSSGLEAIQEILGEIEVPVVFVTSFPERLLTGVGHEPTFLITKPFHPDMIRAVVSQVLFFGLKPSIKQNA